MPSPLRRPRKSNPPPVAGGDAGAAEGVAAELGVDDGVLGVAVGVKGADGAAGAAGASAKRGFVDRTKKNRDIVFLAWGCGELHQSSLEWQRYERVHQEN